MDLYPRGGEQTGVPGKQHRQPAPKLVSETGGENRPPPKGIEPPPSDAGDSSLSQNALPLAPTN